MSIYRIATLAPAKINLFLHVGPLDRQAMHPLSTLMCPLDLYDYIDISYQASETSLHTSGMGSDNLNKNIDDNLCIKATKLFCEALKRSVYVKIDLHKQIPMEAGLGGGSSDAAEIILALNKMEKSFFNEQSLIELAKNIGADVCFFLHKNSCYLRGYGDSFQYNVRLPCFYVLLVKPPIGASTKAVYAQFDHNVEKNFLEINVPKHFQSFQDLICFLRKTNNDLEESAMTLCPDIRSVMGALKKLSHHTISRMTGSGSTCFALFENENEARDAAYIIQKAHPNWWCSVHQNI